LEASFQFEFLVEQKDSRFIELKKWDPLNKFLSLKDFVSEHTEWSQQPYNKIILGLQLIIEQSLHRFVVDPTLRWIAKHYKEMFKEMLPFSERPKLINELKPVVAALLHEMVAYLYGHPFLPCKPSFLDLLDTLVSLDRLKNSVRLFTEPYRNSKSTRARGPLMELLSRVFKDSEPACKITMQQSAPTVMDDRGISSNTSCEPTPIPSNPPSAKIMPDLQIGTEVLTSSTKTKDKLDRKRGIITKVNKKRCSVKITEGEASGQEFQFSVHDLEAWTSVEERRNKARQLVRQLFVDNPSSCAQQGAVVVSAVEGCPSAKRAKAQPVAVAE